MIALSTRSQCDLCGCPASVTVDPDIFLCTECAEFAPDSETPVEPGASVVAVPAPGHCTAADATNSDPIHSRPPLSPTTGSATAADAPANSASAAPSLLGAALAEPTTVAADLDSDDARPNSGLDSRDRGHSSDAPDGPSLTDRQAADGFQQMSSAADPGIAGFNLDFETEVSALEAEWRQRGIIMNATQFCVSVLRDNISKSSNTGA